MPSTHQVKQHVAVDIIKDKFTITTPDGKEVYQAVGEAVSWGNKLSFQDMSGSELACIKQVKVVSAYPKCEVVRDGETWAELSKQNNPFAGTKVITMEIPGPNDCKIVGDLMAWHFKVERTTNGALAATVDKKWGFGDAHGVKVEDGEDDVAILLATIVIDQVHHDDDRF